MVKLYYRKPGSPTWSVRCYPTRIAALDACNRLRADGFHAEVI